MAKTSKSGNGIPLFSGGLRSLKRLAKRLLTPLVYLSLKALDRSSTVRKARFDAASAGLVLSEGDENYLVSAADRVIGREIYVNREFDFEKVDRAFRLAGVQKNGLTFIDVGANVGSICIPVVKRNYAGSAVAIEPEPLNVRLLRSNVILNGLDDAIKVIPVAVGAESGNVEFELSADNFGDHRVHTATQPPQNRYDENARKVITVSMLRLDDVFEAGMPDNAFIWIDTQGYEGFVLAGAPRLLAQRFPLVIEFWPYGMLRCNSYGRLIETVLASGYSRFYDLSENDPPAVELTKENLDALHSRLGEHGPFTDILLS